MRAFLWNRARSLLAPSSLRRLLVLGAVLAVVCLCYRLLALEASRAGEAVAMQREAAGYLARLNAVWAEEREAEGLHRPGGDHSALRENVASRQDEGDVVARKIIKTNVLPRVLLLYDTASWRAAKAAKVFLEAQSISFDLHRHYSYRVPMLTAFVGGRETGLFSVILASSSVSVFHHWSERERQPYLAYCRKYGVPLVGLTPLKDDQEKLSKAKLGNLTIFHIEPESIQKLSLNDSHKFHYAKPGVDITNHIQRSERWFGFKIASSAALEASQANLPEHDGQVATAATQYSTLAAVTFAEAGSRNSNTVAVAIQDTGLYDGVVTLLLASPLTFWLTKLLLMDAIRALSPLPLLRFGRERWVMVDIDDIFVAPPGTKMVPEDVQVSQSKLLHPLIC